MVNTNDIKNTPSINNKNTSSLNLINEFKRLKPKTKVIGGAIILACGIAAIVFLNNLGKDKNVSTDKVQISTIDNQPLIAHRLNTEQKLSEYYVLLQKFAGKNVKLAPFPEVSLYQLKDAGQYLETLGDYNFKSVSPSQKTFYEALVECAALYVQWGWATKEDFPSLKEIFKQLNLKPITTIAKDRVFIAHELEKYPNLIGFIEKFNEIMDKDSKDDTPYTQILSPLELNKLLEEGKTIKEIFANIEKDLVINLLPVAATEPKTR
jgi:hypothetical protein